MRLTKSDYQVENNKPVVYLFCRDNNGKRSIIKDSSLVPYFYILKDETINDNRVVRIEDVSYKSIFGEELRKVIVNLPGDVPKLREKVTKSFEADIPFQTRYLIDKIDSIEPTTPRILFMDIEVDATLKIPDPKIANNEIICIGMYDSQEERYITLVQRSDLIEGTNDRLFDDSLHTIHYFKSEISMMRAFIKMFGDLEPDIVTGWNIKLFDLLYILNRLSNFGIRYSDLSSIKSAYIREYREPIIKGVALIDLIDAYKSFASGEEESYTLDFIGKKVTGRSKFQYDGSMRFVWLNQLEKLIEYNACDVEICRKIENKLKLLSFMNEIRTLTFCQLEDALVTSRISDSYILRMFHNKLVFPTKVHRERVSYEGAFVGSWAKGIYENVVVFDLKSLYPSIIVSAELSLESMVDIDNNSNEQNIIKLTDKIGVDRSIKGFLPQVIENLFIERAKYKTLMNKETIGSDMWNLYDRRQYTVKVLMNALYGQCAYPNSRIYEPKVAEVITYLGRKINAWSRDFLKSIGVDVIYADTDSVFFSIGNELDKQLIGVVLNALNSSYDDFAKEIGLEKHIFQIEFEKVYRRAFFGSAKKRYAGSCIYKNGQNCNILEIVGFEARRSDSSSLSRELQRRLFDMLLKEDKSKEEILRYIGSEIDRVRKGIVKLSEIGIPKGITKELDDYRVAQANVRGARYMRDNLGIDLSSKPKMIYVKNVPEGMPKTDVICFDNANQVPPGVEIDVEKMLDRLVRTKIERIFEALGWDMKELVYFWDGKPKGKGQLSLGI